MKKHFQRMIEHKVSHNKDQTEVKLNSCIMRG